MELNLDRDLVFFDIEATGLNVLRDRIVQIALIKYSKSGESPIELSLMINPAMPISEEAMAVHGITPEMVRNKPTFDQVAHEILNFIGDADLSGYNLIRYDVPMLMEEFHRAGIDFDVDRRRIIDVQRIFYKMEPRTLKAAYKYYCDAFLEDAHDALADVRATAAVFKGQLDKYENVDWVDGDGYTHPNPIRNDMQAISDFTNDMNIIDVTQRLKKDAKGVVVFNFGKYQGQPVGETLYRDKAYYNWILEKEFSVQVKKAVRKLVKEYEQSRQSNS